MGFMTYTNISHLATLQYISMYVAGQATTGAPRLGKSKLKLKYRHPVAGECVKPLEARTDQALCRYTTSISVASRPSQYAGTATQVQTETTF
jgi:hypothetical protein